MTTVRAAVVQAAPVAFNLKKTLDKTDRLLSEAAATGAELVVFPEAFVSCSEGKYGFDVVGHYAHPDAFQLSVNERWPPSSESTRCTKQRKFWRRVKGGIVWQQQQVDHRRR